MRGRAHASLYRCCLTGSSTDGEVNRATDAILLQPMAPAFAADARLLPSLGQAHDELPPLHLGGPRVEVNCSLLRHSECAVRVLPLKAAEGHALRPPHVEAAFFNCVLENNKLALALTPASLVPALPSPSSQPLAI